MADELTPKWLAITNAALVGWNVGLVAAFFAAIAIGVVSTSTLGPITDTTGIALTLLGAAAVGITIGVILARKIRFWFAQRSSARGYVWLAILLIATLLSIPAPFNLGLG